MLVDFARIWSYKKALRHLTCCGIYISMGHRQLFSSSQIFENEHDQVWNPGEQPYMHLAENGDLVYPPENTNREDAPFTAPWNAVPRPAGYSASGTNIEMPPRYQPALPGPPNDSYPHPPTVGCLNMAQDSYPQHSSSHHGLQQPFHGTDSGFFELSMGQGGGLHKRKHPSEPPACERGNPSRYYDAGSSSADQSIQAGAWLEKQNADSHRLPVDFMAQYRGNGDFLGNEGTSRNVRSRPNFELGSNQSRSAHLSFNPPHHSLATQHPEHPRTVDLMSQSSTHTYSQPASNGINLVSDPNFLSHETNNFGALNPVPPVDMGVYHNDFSTNRNAVPQALGSISTQYSRGTRNGFNHRPMQMRSVNLHAGSMAASSEEGLGAERYAPRNPRVFSAIGGARSVDRNVRSRIINERFRSISDHAGFRDRSTPEGLVIMDRTAVYGSRGLDHHREMRLDIDNMSYEELLALGERIGTVNTGLSEDLLSKSLTVSIYCAPDQPEDDGKCAICLEEYVNMDELGVLQSCRHDYHAECIRKWLSMKNSCPICKTAAVDDAKMKGK